MNATAFRGDGSGIDVGSYTFNIIVYDRMFQSTTPTYLLSGKFSCIYEDRTGILLSDHLNKLQINSF